MVSDSVFKFKCRVFFSFSFKKRKVWQAETVGEKKEKKKKHDCFFSYGKPFNNSARLKIFMKYGPFTLRIKTIIVTPYY